MGPVGRQRGRQPLELLVRGANGARDLAGFSFTASGSAAISPTVWSSGMRETRRTARGIPLLEGRGAVDARPTAYVCRNYACELPVTDPATLASQLDASR